MKYSVRAAVTVLTACGCLTAAAADTLELAPVIVTASRYEKTDLETPATTEVITAEQVETMGAQSALDAMRFATGVIYKANTVGDTGGEFLIRGKRRGTLVLLDGMPLNYRNGYADLDTIPAEMIERIEVVRGGGAVLYGSDATGGVINVITKKQRQNIASVSAGNFDRQRHQIVVGDGKFSVGYTLDKKGTVLHTSQPSNGKIFHFHGGTKQIGEVQWNITDELRFRTTYNDYHYKRSYNYVTKGPEPVIYDWRDIHSKDWQAGLQYEKDGLSATLAYHNTDSKTQYTYWDYAGKTSAELLGILDRKYYYDTIDRLYSFDLHKEWQTERGTALFGVSADHSFYRISQRNKPKWNKSTGRFIGYEDPAFSQYSRNVYSAYASYEHHFNDRHMLSGAMRETWTGNSYGDKEYNQFTPQIQYLYTPSETVSWFVSYGESFTLPTLPDLYGKGDTAGNAKLEPETGKHYELGVKYRHENTLWKVSLFRADVKNFMRLKDVKDPVTGEPISVPLNEDTKNAGVEISVTHDFRNGWSADAGLVFQNPKFFDASKAAKGWQRDYGRIQANAGVSYRSERWDAGLYGSYLGRRVLSSYQEEVRPLFITAFHLAYRQPSGVEIFLDVDNVLNRRDITSHVSSRYNMQPRNYLLGVKYRW